MFSVLLSISAIRCSLLHSTGEISKESNLVIRWAYQHYILAVEVKNSAKVTLLSFNITAVFLHDVMVSENDVLEAG